MEKQNRSTTETTFMNGLEVRSQEMEVKTLFRKILANDRLLFTMD